MFVFSQVTTTVLAPKTSIFEISKGIGFWTLDCLKDGRNVFFFTFGPFKVKL